MTPRPRWWRAALAALVIPLLAVPCQSQGPAQRFTVGGRDIVKVDFANTSVGDFPASLEMVDGIMDVVSMYGQNMLRASSRSVFLVRLPQVLPQDFTLEFEVVPKAGGNPEDLTVEGTPTINQGAGSAHVMWHRDNLKIVGGGPLPYDAVVPPSIAAALPGALTQVAITMQGPLMKLYTNGRLMFTQQRQFVRGRVLRVFLGGQDDGPNAVHLAGLRVIDGAAVVPVVASGAPGGSNPTGAAPGQPSALNPGANPVPNVGGGAGTASSSSAMTGGSLAGSLSGGQPQSTTSSTPAPGTAVGVPPQVTAPSGAVAATGTVAGGTASTPGQTAATQGLSSPTNPLPNVGGSSSSPATVTAYSSGTTNAPAYVKGTTIDLHILLQWAPVSGAVSYNIYRKEGTGPAAGVLLPYQVEFPSGVAGVFSGAGTIDPHLTPNASMTYVVEAVFAGGTKSAPSASLTLVAPAFLAGARTSSLTPKAAVEKPQRLPALNGGTGSLVTWTWDAVPRHFGYGIAIDIVPNAGVAATQRIRDFRLAPPVNDQTMTVPISATVWSQAIPSNSTVYFCYSRWRLDHPATAIPDIARLYLTHSGSSYSGNGVACERTIVP